MAFLLQAAKARPADENLARTAGTDGQASFQGGEDTIRAPLCDEQGHLLVRPVGAGGYEAPLQVASVGEVVLGFRGSAPNVNNDGLVENQLVLTDAVTEGSAPGYPKCIRLFGYSQVAGFVQLHLRDETTGTGLNPPVTGAIPEVIIPIDVGQSFTFGDYLFAPSLLGSVDTTGAVYITLSSTGPTFTSGIGANLWFYFLGSR